MNRLRNGAAVMAALFAIILLGALCAGMAFAAGEEARASAAKLPAVRALAVVEGALADALSNIDWAAAAQLPPGQPTAVQKSGHLPAAVTMVRLDTTCFFVQAVTPDPSAAPVKGRIVRRVGLTIELIADSSGVFRPLIVPNRGWAELF